MAASYKKFAFEIKDKSDSEYHQTEFFNMGYSWVIGKVICHESAKYLFLDPHVKTLSWSSTLDNSSGDYILCKLLKPKQLEFLKEIHETKLQKHNPLDFAIRFNCYKVEDSDYLNALRNNDMVNKFINNNVK